MKKRKTCFIMKPSAFEISCDICEGSNITWSEFEHMIWCFSCKKDTPGNGGIFDGPVSIQMYEMLGISFDKVDLATGERLTMKEVDGSFEW